MQAAFDSRSSRAPAPSHDAGPGKYGDLEECVDQPGHDVRQTFTPSLPRLTAVEVELVIGNPGPADDTLTLTVLGANESTVVTVTKTVPTADSEHVLFVFPKGGVEVSPGQSYSLRLSDGTAFGWKYVVGGYEKGSASFNGQPLLPGARSTFLFKPRLRYLCAVFLLNLLRSGKMRSRILRERMDYGTSQNKEHQA